ncbi:nucleotidyl transferase AbiEii/AbiGii toxin family protein (plasmid) [Agrobacterium tumefaciens]|uniref:nucleotidyl transferase AbiEii/AbiGii toxin family protein n=1 Tax=Agrobacterium tumefaciens TaxID=358 RepID=UPI001BB6D0B8|nr:nucleotidyl transferase AbiEii/AbiGii toxin family protein [Agrobacterium tumefaciens]
MSQWESLFDQAASIINQANSSFKLLDSWTFGGGTALMLQINHRESFDIDIFVDDPQVLPYLNPLTQGYTLQVNPDEYVSDGTHALKIVFAGIGEIDFICAPSLTNDPTSRVAVRGIQVDLETPGEIIAKKVHYRGSSLQPRDMFDIACIAKACGDGYVLEALLPFKNRAAVALAVAERMDAGLASTVMGKLQYREGYAGISKTAQATTISLLKAVCDHKPSVSAAPSSTSPR